MNIVSKLFNYFDVSCGSSRFNFLLQGNHFSRYCKSLSAFDTATSPPPVLLMMGKDFNIYWEYRDGVMDVAPVESVVVLYQILELVGNSKPFVYVKPNFSPLKCRNIANLAQENNGVVITCPKWSYMTFYENFYPIRHEIRKSHTFKNKTLDAVFLGRIRTDRPTPRCVADYTDERYRYPVYRSQIDFLKGAPKFKVPDVDPCSISAIERGELDESRKQTEIPDYPQRPWFLKKIREHIPVTHIENKTHNECLDVYLQSKVQFQPHGVGPRHSIYESMMLGIPSIIPECSYLDAVTREHNFICSELMHYVPVDDIKNVMESESLYTETREKIIDLYETYMTHEAIINSVFNRIEKII